MLKNKIIIMAHIKSNLDKPENVYFYKGPALPKAKNENRILDLNTPKFKNKVLLIVNVIHSNLLAH